MLGRKLKLILLFVFFLFVSKAFAVPDFSSSPHVYRISVSGCTFEPKLRTQTGFRIREKSGIVTALHGLADCSRISAVPDDPSQKAFADLEMVAVDIARDVALISSRELDQEPKNGFTLAELRKLPDSEFKKLQWVGYPYEVNLQIKHEEVIGNILRPLTDLIPQEPQKILRERESPNLSVIVLRLQTQLLPGTSGAPVLTDDGQVIAMVDGGLDGGLSSVISWAIPLEDIFWQSKEQAKTALDRLAVMSPEEALSFSSTFPKDSVRTVRFSAVTDDSFESYRFHSDVVFSGLLNGRIVNNTLTYQGLLNERNNYRATEISGDMLSVFADQFGYNLDIKKFGLYELSRKSYGVIEGTESLCQEADPNVVNMSFFYEQFSQVLSQPITSLGSAPGVLLGEEIVNGQRVRHYLLDPAAINASNNMPNFKIISGDIWVTADTGHLIRLEGNILSQGAEIMPGQTFTGRVFIGFEFKDIGKNLIADLPEICDVSPSTPRVQLNAKANIESVAPIFDLFQNGQKGMVINVDFTVDNMKGIPGEARSYFLFKNGQPLQGFSPQFQDEDGDFISTTLFTPNYSPTTRFTDLEIFVPYDELHMNPGQYDLLFYVAIYHQPTGKLLVQSENIEFQFSQPNTIPPALPDVPSLPPLSSSIPPGSSSVSIQSISQTHNVPAGLEQGMNIVVNYTLNNANGASCIVAATFFDFYGQQLRDFDSSYADMFGNVYVDEAMTPYGGNTSWTTTLFIPYSQLHMVPGNHSLQVQVAITCLNPFMFAAPIRQSFTLNQQ